MRLVMPPGAYGGAAFAAPPALALKGGVIRPGLWKDYALPTYSGIGVYTQRVTLTERDIVGKMLLDLGRVLVAAEVFVNGKCAGVRLARPFTFDLTGFLKAGENTIEVRVANTIAPHYTTIPALNLGPTDSGLLGPVRLVRQLAWEKWRAWGSRERKRLERVLTTMTPELKAAQRAWEKNAGWMMLSFGNVTMRSGTGVKTLEDSSILVTGLGPVLRRSSLSGGTFTVTYPDRLRGVTGFRRV